MTDEVHPAPPGSNPDGPAKVPVRADFLKAAAAKIKANLELLLGKPILLETGEPVALDATEMAAKVPAPCLALAVRSSGAVDATLHCFAAHPLTLAMICHAQLKSDEAAAERLSGDPRLTDEDRAGMKDVASFIMAGLGDFAKDTTGGRIVLAPSEPRMLEAGENAGGDAGSYVYLDSRVALAPAPPSALAIVVPRNLAEAWMQPGAPAPAVFGSRSAPGAAATRDPDGAPDGAEAQRSLWIAAGDPLVVTAREAAGRAFAVRAFASLPELMAAADAGPPPEVAVFEVPAAADFELDVIAALRRHPALSTSRFVVALHQPTRRHVIRCAMLGLSNVVPAGVDPRTLSSRLLARPRGVPGRRGP